MIIAGTTLGKKGGLHLCGDVKSDQGCKNIPFILLRGGADDISDQDRERVHADGMISKPFRGDDVFNLVERLIVGETMKKQKETLLNELKKMDEEDIIELVDVVEEPESKLSISDLVAPEKEDLLGDIAPLESWEKPVKGKS